jgi:hypothetical protein
MSRARLMHERNIALGHALEPSSQASYSSALQSYVTFCQNHSMSIEPTPETLSFYIVYMYHFIPKSVPSYLSGICNQLETFYPKVRASCKHCLVLKTLCGCKKLHASPASRKRPLHRTKLTEVHNKLNNLSTYDDLLFLAILFIGFFALMRLGELVWPDNKSLQSFRKITLRSSFSGDQNHIEFNLPTHKADKTFDGSTIMVWATNDKDCPVAIMLKYVAERDKHFPALPHLWVKSDGSIPTRSWFIRRLRTFFSDNVAGHSLRSGGATFLAQIGAPSELIQAAGCWVSDTFKIYIRQHPVLLTALLFGQHSN